MLLPRMPIPRKLSLRHLSRPQNGVEPLSRARLFTNRSPLLLVARNTPRPQLPFLPTYFARKHGPFLGRTISTEQKENYKYQVKLGLYWSLIGWIIFGAGSLSWYIFREDWLDHLYPSPKEWSWFIKHFWRSLEHEVLTDGQGTGQIDWGHVGNKYRVVVELLEDSRRLWVPKSYQPLGPHDDWDRSLPGLDLEDVMNEPRTRVWNLTKIGLDCSDKPEPWRRGYYVAMMGQARAAQYMENYVMDNSTNIIYAANKVVGPSNPYPAPVFPITASPPLEENCQPLLEEAGVYYIRILTTKGFNRKQRMDAGLAYAQWLDFKGNSSLASQYYHWSLDLACAGLADAESIVDHDTGVIPSSAPFTTPNILATTTALASHHARTGNLSAAINVYASILRARCAAPDAPPHKQYTPRGPDYSLTSIASVVQYIVALPFTPMMAEEPPSGDEPFERTPEVECDEAAIMAYVGEIMFANGSQREGLGWTRDAVAISEKRREDERLPEKAKKVCTQCLKAGLGNWHRMVATLASEAQERPTLPETKGWKKWIPLGGERIVVSEEVDWQQEEKMVARKKADFEVAELNKKLRALVSKKSNFFVV